MDNAYAAVSVFLMLNLLAGLVRIYRGPTPADRLLAAQLLGTTGTAVLLVLSAWQGLGALIDAAIIFALLAAVTLIAFVCRLWTSLPAESEEHDDVVD
ncbi:MAG TPA: monovalent cation/H+ antiporter complex subunit F [Kiritimatiellia bacterium]|nr:monovalent cation/H+ antiporter complex subunit F [Kiritimatiellia bacterium]